MSNTMGATSEAGTASLTDYLSSLRFLIGCVLLSRPFSSGHCIVWYCLYFKHLRPLITRLVSSNLLSNNPSYHSILFLLSSCKAICRSQSMTAVEANMCRVCYLIHISLLPLETPFIKRRGLYSIDGFNPTTYICLSQTRILIFNSIHRGLYCVE